jgi:hypothetical protein
MCNLPVVASPSGDVDELLDGAPRARSSSATQDAGLDRPRPAAPTAARLLTDPQVARHVRNRPARLEVEPDSPLTQLIEYFLGLPIAGASPSPRTAPGVGASKNPESFNPHPIEFLNPT